MISTNLVALTGRARAGKDHTAKILQLETISIADPLYEICEYYLKSCDKENPTHRRFLQLVGAWGRGTQEPDTTKEIPLRKDVSQDLNALGNKITPKISSTCPIDWSQFGKNQDFWLNIILARAKAKIQQYGHKTHLAIPNIRFTNELEAFQRLGFLHLHIHCSEETITQRRGPNFGETNNNDPTEDLAKTLDLTLHGPTVIWNDPQKATPENSGYTHIQDLIRQNK